MSPALNDVDVYAGTKAHFVYGFDSIAAGYSDARAKAALILILRTRVCTGLESGFFIEIHYCQPTARWAATINSEARTAYRKL